MGWALTSVVSLFVACFGALVTEFSGMGHVYGLDCHSSGEGAVVVATAATFAVGGGHTALTSVGSIARALSAFLGWDGARILFGLGMIGAAFVAALVVSLAGARGRERSVWLAA